MSFPAADDSGNALAAAARHQAANDAAAGMETQVRYGLRQFPDSFIDAVQPDFLAEADEARLRARYSGQSLRDKLNAHLRTLMAQRALQSLYCKLLDGAAMTVEERALAEHARDLCDAAVDREVRRRCQQQGI